MVYQTPRMLARTLRILRRHRKLSGGQLGKKIGRSKSAISNYETRANPVSYKLLDCYQVLFGAPNGIILCISHTAAMARDASVGQNSKMRERETLKLKLMGRYLRQLSDRILEPKGRVPLWSYPGLKRDDPATWTALLEDIFRATQDGIPEDQNRLFENPDRLAKILAEDRDKPRDHT